MNQRTADKTPVLLLALMFLLGLLFSFCCAGADSAEAMLESGSDLNNKMRYLSAGEEKDKWSQTDNVKAVRMADTLPEGFVPSKENTVSVSGSGHPAYIFYDNTDDAGIIYFYAENSRIVMNPDSSFMFFDFQNLNDISGVADWDASHVTTMYSMFARARSLTDAAALRNWDTSSVTNMDFMFSGASSMVRIDVSNWDTGKVTSMSGMFQVGDNWKGNGELVEIIGLGNMDVSNVRDMTCMFYGAGKMTQYDIAGWDVSKVESMNHMFCDNFSLRSLDLSGWNVSSVRTMYCMFDDNHALKTIGDVSHWNTCNLIDVGGWLNDCLVFVGDNRGTMDLSGWDTSKLKSAGEMFLRTKIHTINLSGWTFDSMTNDPWEDAGRGHYYAYGNGDALLCGFGQMFGSMGKLERVYLSQSGLESYQRAVEKGVNTLDMWKGSQIEGFTVR